MLKEKFIEENWRKIEGSGHKKRYKSSDGNSEGSF